MHTEAGPRVHFIPLQEINRHGFSGPMTPQQSAPVLLAFLNLTEAVYMITTDTPSLKLTLLLTALLATFIALLVLWVLTTLSDPTDPVQLQHRAAILNEYEFD